MSVSIVAVACLRFAQAALWNGHAHHSTTGVASCSDSHCQLSNCSAEIIDMASTGIDSTALTIRRKRSVADGSCSAGSSAPDTSLGSAAA